jgi:serine/threonine-protein kinase HipA
MNAFLELHKDLPREGPGSDEATARALALLPGRPPNPVIFDMGCGPGRQSLVLAKELGARIIAIDIFEQYLEQLQVYARDAGLSSLIETRNQSMDALREPDGSIDLIWAEGSIYILGFERLLKYWARFLKPKGLVVASELTWFTHEPHPEALEFWRSQYPDMESVSGNTERAARSGYRVLDHFRLDDLAWWTEYLAPLEKRMESFERMPEQDPDLENIIKEQREENRIVRRRQDDFGYIFYIMQKVL